MSFFGKNFAQARLEVHSLAVACGGLSIFATFSKVSVGFLKDGDFLKFALFGAANLFFACGPYIWLRPLYRNFFQAVEMRLKTIC